MTRISDTGLWSEIIVQDPRPPPRLDLTICTARLPYDENQGTVIKLEIRCSEVRCESDENYDNGGFARHCKRS